MRQAGVFTARVHNSEKSSDLPGMHTTEFNFAINLKTAKTLGLDVLPTLLAGADGVIE